MKYPLVLLSFIFLTISSCQKTELTRTFYPYEQSYSAQFYLSRDSMQLQAQIGPQTAYPMMLNDTQSVTVNGLPGSYVEFLKTYKWQVNGLQDMTIKFTKGQQSFTNAIKVLPIDQYTVSGLADTLHRSATYQMTWNPSADVTDIFVVNFELSDGSTWQNAKYKPNNTITFDNNFFFGRPDGKTKINMSWYRNYPLQMADGDAGGHIMAEVILEKEVIIAP